MPIETVRYIDSRGGTTTLSDQGRYLSGAGVDTWNVAPVFDQIIGEENLFSGYAVESPEFGLSFALSASSYENARSSLAAWRQLFMRDVSRAAQGTIQIVFNGGTYVRDVASVTPEISGPDGQYVGVNLRFQSRSPFWVYNTTQGTASAFAGTAAVNVTWNNTGDYLAYPVHHLTGAAGTPRMTNLATSQYLEIGTAIPNADDQVYVWTDSPLIRYYEHGTGAGVKTSGVNWTKYAGTVSHFFGLQVEAGTVQLSAAAGSAVYALSYDIRKAGLG